MFVAFISALACCATITRGVREISFLRSRTDVSGCRSLHVPYARSGMIWGALLALTQAFISVYALVGMIQNDILSALVMNVVICCCAGGCFAAARMRPRFVARMRATSSLDHPIALSVAAILLAGALTVLALEVPTNHNITWMYPFCLLLEYCLITAALAGLFFLSQRRGGPAAVLALVFALVGIMEYFVLTFKSMPIQPGDISAISTAVSVAGHGCRFSMTAFCLYGIAASAGAITLCLVAGLLRPEPGARGRTALIVNILVGLACLGGIGAHVTLIDYYNTLLIQVYTWRPLESYYRQGFLPSFIASAQTIIPPKPKDYDPEKAAGLIQKYAADYDANEGTADARKRAEAQFDQDKPTVIAVMNETFSDLSVYKNMHADYPGPQHIKSLTDTLQHGSLAVSAYGGGTCNIEFEFLTGNSMSFLGQGVYPYTIYNLSQADSLAKRFNSLGYSTTAMHPNHGTNWNRENVYQDLGFNRFLTIPDFQGADTLRNMVTDRATYDKTLELLEQDSAPQFIFDVTMQNHSGYDTRLIPADKLDDYRIDNVSNPEVNEYLSLIDESDRSLDYFIRRLSKLNRKVVLVFWGDHQPYFPSTYNDRWFTGENEATHSERLWQTPYIIWSNYDVAGLGRPNRAKDTSSNFLGANLMNLIGAPLTDYQKAQLAVSRSMPSINVTGYRDDTLVWHLSNAGLTDGAPSSAEKAATRARNDLSLMQYLRLFGHGGNLFTSHAQNAANETDPNLKPGTTKIR